MQEIWAFLVAVVIIMIVYGYMSSKLSEKRKKKAREKTVPQIKSSIKTGVKYNIHLSDGRLFQNAEIIGSVDSNEEDFSFANWEGMLVIQQGSGKKAYLRTTAIRFVEEV